MLPLRSHSVIRWAAPNISVKMPSKARAKSKPARRRQAAAKAAKVQAEHPAIAALAHSHAEAALAALIEVVGDRTASPAARISAASALLNWGFGKSNPVGNDGNEGPAELVIRWRDAQDGPSTKPKSKPKS